MVYAIRILKQYPEILSYYRKKYRYICVDEAQDTSLIQHRIIEMLAGNEGNIFMVGDEDQSIYGFRGACPNALLSFTKTYPRGKVLLMEENYRSSIEIVECSNRFIQKCPYRYPKAIKPTFGHGAEVREINVSARIAQYRYVAKLAANCERETAILYRNNDSAIPVIDLLQREGLPYRSRQLDTGFFTHWQVRDIQEHIAFANTPVNTQS